jgi:hypothetical protein
MKVKPSSHNYKTVQYPQKLQKNIHLQLNLPQIKILRQDLGSRDPNLLWTLFICI